MSTELDRNNQLVWAWGSNGVYSPKSAYTMLAGGGEIKWSFVEIWSYKIPPSVRIFVFLLLRNGLLTHEVMVRRGFDIPPNCESCNRGAIESTLHLFFLCPKAVRLWERMASILGVMLMHMDTTVQGTWQISVSRAAAAGMRKKQWQAYFVSTCWSIWKQRNKKIFEGQEVPLKVVEENILQDAKLWLRLC